MNVKTTKQTYSSEFNMSMLKLAFVMSTPSVQQVGYKKIPEERCIPFSDWSKKHDLHMVHDLVKTFHTGLGYGFYHELPAIYALKYLLKGGKLMMVGVS
jgi:hypothetical protein